MWYSDMDSQLGDLEEGREEIGGANNTYLSVIEVCFKNRRFPEEIMHAGAI
jgi:hypothetical protein